METSCPLKIYDNTLRDGEQTAGVSFSMEDKVCIARKIAAAGIRRFEAGFAGVSPEEAASLGAVMRLGLDAEIYSLARLNQADLDAAARAGVHGVTLIAPASDALVALKGFAAPEDVEPEIETWVAYAKKKKLKVKFSCVDATRTPFNRLLRWYGLARGAGADMVSYADTVGIAMPDAVSRAVRELKRVLQMPVSIHAHNDLGLALANSLAAFHAGADEVQVTVNGLGERAGNAGLEELVMAMKAGAHVDLGIDLPAMMDLSRTVRAITGLEPGFNCPVIGRNVFRHESGIHVQGMLGDGAPVFEPFPPAWIGRAHEVVFGKHSGKSNLRHLCRECGMAMNAVQEKEILEKIKILAQARSRELTQGEVLHAILKPWHAWEAA